MKKIAVIGALEAEIKHLAEEFRTEETDLLGSFGKACVANAGAAQVLIVCCGVGKVNAAMTVSAVIERFSPDCVVNIGAAGALAESLRPLDVVVSSEAVYHDYRDSGAGFLMAGPPFAEVFKADEGLVRMITGGGNPNIITGRIATGDAFIEDKEEAREIRRCTGALCVDMESAAVGHVCHACGVPFVCVRSVSDSADENAKISFGQLVEKAAEQAAEVIRNIFSE